MPNWIINKWAGGIAPDEYYGQEGTFRHVAGLRCGQDLRYVTPANAKGSPVQTFTTGGTHTVRGIMSLNDVGIVNTMLYMSRQSNTTYLWKDSTNVFSTSGYIIENFAPQSISGTMNMIYQTYTGNVYKNDLTNMGTSSWTLNLISNAAHSSGFGCYNVSLDGAALLIAQGNAVHSVNSAGSLTRHFYIGDSSGSAGYFGIAGVTKFADQVKVYYGFQSPKIYYFSASELAAQSVGAIADSAKPSYSVELPNVRIDSVVNDGPVDYVLGAEHGYPVIFAINGYSVSRVYSGKTRSYTTSLSSTLYNATRDIAVQFVNQKNKNMSIVSGKRIYFGASSSGDSSRNYVGVYGGLLQDGIDNGMSLRNYVGETVTSLDYSTGNSYSSALYAGTSSGNVYRIPSESTTGSAASSTGYLITRDFDGGLYSMRKVINEIDMGAEIGNGSSIELAVSTSSSNAPTYRIVKSFASTDVFNGRLRVTPNMLVANGAGYGEFNKISYRIKLTNGSSSECRLYDVNTRWSPAKQ